MFVNVDALWHLPATQFISAIVVPLASLTAIAWSTKRGSIRHDAGKLLNSSRRRRASITFNVSCSVRAPNRDNDAKPMPGWAIMKPRSDDALLFAPS